MSHTQRSPARRGATINEQRVPARREATGNGEFVLWVRRVSAMANRIGFLAGWDGPRIARMTRIRGGQRTTINDQRATSKLVLVAAGVCDAGLDWRMDVADGAGNSRVRMPGIRAVKTLQKLSHAHSQRSEVSSLRLCCGEITDDTRLFRSNNVQNRGQESNA